MATSGDPVRAQRARAVRLAVIGQRLGYALFLAAMVLLVVGLLTELTGGLTAAVVACLIVGAGVLAPAILLGFAARAAEREDRAAGR
ncbi:hypothetical protein BH18ACT1_BH18ACT1_08630 [soil metagenome]